MCNGAIFDLDGVVLDSMSIWNDLGARYLRRLGVAPEPGLNEILFSMSMEQGAAYLQTRYALPMTAQEVGAGIEEMLQDYYYNEVPAKDGAPELLAFLAERGIGMAAATSSPRGHVTRALARLGLLEYFTEIFTTVVFEDSLYALQTAKAAGFITVGVYDANGEADQPGLKKAADLYVKCLGEVPITEM